MKKLIVSLIALLMLVSLAGCGTKEKAEEKAAAAITEKAIENATGGNVDIDDDKMTITGENGESLTVGSSEWPTSELAKTIPEFKAGEITSVMESSDGVWITLESVKKEDAAAYLETIKETFAQESFEMNAEDSVTYGAKNADGVSITFQYSDETLALYVGRTA